VTAALALLAILGSCAGYVLGAALACANEMPEADPRFVRLNAQHEDAVYSALPEEDGEWPADQWALADSPPFVCRLVGQVRQSRHRAARCASQHARTHAHTRCNDGTLQARVAAVRSHSLTHYSRLPHAQPDAVGLSCEPSYLEAPKWPLAAPALPCLSVARCWVLPPFLNVAFAVLGSVLLPLLAAALLTLHTRSSAASAKHPSTAAACASGAPAPGGHDGFQRQAAPASQPLQVALGRPDLLQLLVNAATSGRGAAACRALHVYVCAPPQLRSGLASAVCAARRHSPKVAPIILHTIARQA
jgi:hypothetical protein